MSRLRESRLGGSSASKNTDSYNQDLKSHQLSCTQISSSNYGNSGTKIDPNDCVPKRFGLRFDPPAIVMEYLVPSSGKLYHHKMKVHNLSTFSDTADILEELKEKHHSYFAGNKISDSQMKNLIDKLKKVGQENEKICSDIKSGVKILSSINTCESTTIKGKGNPLVVSDSNKDELIKCSKGLDSKETSDRKKAANSNGFWEFDELEDLSDNEQELPKDEKVFDYNNFNLNKLSSNEVQKHKDKMDVLFNKNQKRPGDAGFVYDKQVEFVPVDAHEWDDEF